MNYEQMTERLNCGAEDWAQPYLSRRWTRRGARNFLIEYGAVQSEPEWRKIYSENVYAAKIARYLGFRIPAAASDRDRARVLRLAAKEGVMLARDFPAIYRWATRVRR